MKMILMPAVAGVMLAKGLVVGAAAGAMAGAVAGSMAACVGCRALRGRRQGDAEVTEPPREAS